MAQLGVGGDERLEPERAKRATVVGHDRDHRGHVALVVDLGEVAQGPAAQLGGLGQGELDRGDRVVHVRRRGDVEPVLVLAPVVPAAGDPPGPTGGGLELGEVQLPDLVRAGRWRGERGLAARGQLAAFTLVVGLKEQTLLAQQAQHGGLGDAVPVVADHRPDLAVPPCWVGQSMGPDRLADPGPGRARPRALDRVPGPGAGLMATPGPLGHADQRTEP